MRAIRSDPFIELVKQWFAANAQRVGQASVLDGGWEAWLQAELCMYLNATMFHGTESIDVQREVNYPGSADRVDLLLNGTFTPPTYPEDLRVWVELKTQTPRYTENNFAQAVVTDVTKLNTQLPLNIPKVMIAVFLTDRTVILYETTVPAAAIRTRECISYPGYGFALHISRVV